MGWESFGVVGFDLGILLQGQTRIPKLKSAYNSLIIGLTGLGWKTNLKEIMGWESSGVVRFDLGALPEGQMWSLIPIMVYISLITGRRGLDLKTTYGKSCGKSFDVVIFDLGHRFKVKRG